MIEGAKQNNLKNVSLKLPHNKVIAVTGLSGSGKSSLAFDTVFAEGQWRFIESLSTYARLFIEKLDRPDVDSIRNIRPAIALEQHNPVKGSRSTVGTLTEVYDLLRVLFARVGKQFCPECGERIVRWNVSSIVRDLTDRFNGQKAAILFDSNLTPGELVRNGFHRALFDGQIRDIIGSEDRIRSIPVVVDRLVLAESPRLTDSLETAWRYGNGALRVYFPPGRFRNYSGSSRCDQCGFEPHEPTPVLFSFNHPFGACTECKGFGNILKYSPDIVIPDRALSLSKGAVEPWEKPAARWWKRQLLKGAQKVGIDVTVPFSSLPADEQDLIFSGCDAFYGINDFFEELEQKRYKLHVRVFLSRYRSGVTCPECGGKRLNREALSYTIGGQDIADLSDMKTGHLSTFIKTIEFDDHERKVAHDVLEQIGAKLGYLGRVGLDYLSLSRPAKTLSGGEYQRINLSNQIASHLTGTMYVLDEPTVGLHARDTRTIASIMREIAELGNTVIVVEHDRDIIEQADWIVEMGPGGGKEGGAIVFNGDRESFLRSDTLTARWLRDSAQTNPVQHTPMKRHMNTLTIEGCTGHNLKNVSVSVPLGTLTVVTGVSGSGKSSLIVDTLYTALARKLKISTDTPLAYSELSGAETVSDIKLIDQSPLGKSPRSNPVTYMKVFDFIRKLFSETPDARSRGYSAGFFSFNVPGGRCEECKGEGFQKVELYFFEDVFVTCPSCNGKRYSPEALKIAYRSKSINEVLSMTVDESLDFFSGNERITAPLSLMKDIGLGYLRIGQPATTFSGGEAQRLKICHEIAKRTKGRSIYVLDEPTVGLHMQDISRLIAILRLLVRRGDTVIVIEHNLDFVRSADWIIDLGPEGGDRGGEIVYAGASDGIVNAPRSATGKYIYGHID